MSDVLDKFLKTFEKVASRRPTAMPGSIDEISQKIAREGRIRVGDDGENIILEVCGHRLLLPPKRAEGLILAIRTRLNRMKK